MVFSLGVLGARTFGYVNAYVYYCHATPDRGTSSDLISPGLMTEHEPDYTLLSLAELLDVERHIDRKLVPERWARLQAVLASRRAGVPARARPQAVTQSVGPAVFTIMHMIATAVVLVTMLLGFPGEGAESAVGRDLALLLVVPAAFFLSAGSILLYRPFLKARRRRMFLLLSVVITPFASVAVLVIGSSIFFSLLALLFR